MEEPNDPGNELGRIMMIAFDILSGLLALILAAAGIAKLAGVAQMRVGAERFGIPWPRYRLIGVAELAAVLGIGAGLAWRPFGLAAVVGSGILMIGALGYHRRAGDPPAEAAGAGVTLALCLGYLITALVAL